MKRRGNPTKYKSTRFGMVPIRAPNQTPAQIASSAQAILLKIPITLSNLESFNGGSIGREIVAKSTTTISADKYTASVNMGTSSGTWTSIVGAHGPAEALVIDSWVEKNELISTEHFSITPFIYRLENGEAITATESADTDLGSVLMTTLGAQSSSYKILKSVKSKRTPDGKYTCNFTVNLTKDANSWLKDNYKKEFNEITPGPAVVGYGILISAIPSQQIDVRRERLWNYKLVQRKVAYL
jgi:hypothetical protein